MQACVAYLSLASRLSDPPVLLDQASRVSGRMNRCQHRLDFEAGKGLKDSGRILDQLSNGTVFAVHRRA